uniref:PemK-like, MazF-like toxin of type II toxin-antitoxin system n=1 Tax=Candidatus Kentrum sp. MB TaxID=2138164 RepID=A0A451B9L5_9GAMM|nr:MAG: PemK-like, MazF-like toxin of type II toxin-antitoxin system [Candidatus Kentron sp. MB]VFK29896.1 MAG: PemK-like, MazF-like toxin of type II toxin-antitoxin system [Candidatus Kentron sp. MB]VFK74986.1 MAG: PemK-like, MazF-like toxin of type II toxin-antitoxin system [Candidatus Kentron sp. MB]
MERGDIYLVSLDPTSGHEQRGRRPVLIVPPTAFNRLTKTPIVKTWPLSIPVKKASRQADTCAPFPEWTKGDKTPGIPTPCILAHRNRFFGCGSTKMNPHAKTREIC